MTQPRQPHIGPPLRLSPEALHQAAEVTPVDIAQAAALWLQHAPSVFKGLLDAEIIRTGE